MPPGRPYRWYRLEILAALANTLLRFAVAAYVVHEAIHRVGGGEVATTPMMVVAILGLIINLIAFKLPVAGAQEASTSARLTAK